MEKYFHFEHFSHLILDEIHERNIEMDVFIAFRQTFVSHSSRYQSDFDEVKHVVLLFV